jgi:Uncharacterized protein conserved in bacteria (DUF2330)
MPRAGMSSRRRVIRRTIHGVLLAGALTASVGPSAAPACGCGVLLRANEVGEKALVSFRHRVETIVPGLAITRVGPQAAVVFPVPGRPRITALPAGTDVFGELEAATTPKSTEGASSGAGAAAARPTVVSQQQLGGYQVTVLKGGTGETLLAWLSSHSYALPSGSQRILDRYISRRWYFVAIRLADRRAGEIQPLAITFRSRLLAYPMLLSRLSPSPISVELFIDTSGPVSARGVDGFTTTYIGRVSSLSPAPSPAVKALLPEPYLTRLDSNSLAPSAISKDVVLRVPSAAAPKTSSGHPLRYGGAAVLSLAALVAGFFALRRRASSRAGRDRS